MAYMNWSSQYLLGLDEVDRQHQQLFEMVNRLHAAVVNGADRSIAGGILDELIDYAVEHFSTEERLFLQQGYPEYQEHKQEHDQLTRQVLDIQAGFRSGRITASFDLLDFLSEWLKKHTTDSDLKYAQFARQSKLRNP